MLYPTKSFFARVLYTLVPFAVIVALLYSTLVWTSITVTEDHIVNSYLDREAARFEENFARSPTEAHLPTTSYLHSYWERDSDLPPAYLQLGLGRHELDDQRTHVQVLYIAAAQQKFFIELDESQLSSLDRHANLLFSILWGVAGLVIIAGALLAVVGARHLATPVTQLADAVSKGWDPEKKLPGHERADEIGTLSRALTDLVGRLHDALDRERAFTRHASHELRTPLAIIRNTLAVVRLPSCSVEKRDRNLLRLEQASSEMETMVELFLCLGRESERLPGQPVSVHALVLACKDKYRDLIASSGMTIDVDIDPHVTLEAAPTLLKVLTGNLFSNALLHGCDFLHISYSEHSLRLENGIGTHVQPSPGYGYGLDIVQRLCAHCGWTLKTWQEPGRFCAEVDFAPA